MKTTDYIREKIDRLPNGYIFTYNDFITEVNKKEAIIKSLNRMAALGKIAKLSKGKYYKPQSTVFGALLPEQCQIVKDLIEKDGKSIGYITGNNIFNQLGLTAQIGNTIQVGRNETRPPLQRGKYRITFIKQKNRITKGNIPLLQLLDAIRYIKIIPDTNIDSSCKRLLIILRKLNATDKATLTRLALKYPPVTRALTGAMMELIEGERQESIENSLNPITSYKLSISENTLPTIKNWNIK